MSNPVTSFRSQVTGNSKPRAFFAFTVLILAALACGGGSNIPPTLVIDIPTPDAERIATLDLVENDVNARASEAEDMSPAIEGQRLNNDGQVQTLDDSRAHVLFTEGTLIRISENTLLSLADMNTNPNEPVAKFFLEIGKIWLVLQSGTVEVETPIGVAAVRGSYESVEYYPGNPDDPNDDHMIVTCLEGDCTLGDNTGNQVQIPEQYQSFIQGASPPVEPFDMDEEQRDEWYVEVPDATQHAPTFTPTITNTPTATARPTSTPTFTATSTPLQTSTPTNTSTPLPTSTFTATFTPTNTAVDTTSTITATASSTATNTATLEDTSTASQTASPSHAPTSSHTATPSQTATATATNVAPVVSNLVEPPNSMMCPPDPFTFKADASDSDGTISDVWIEFQIDSSPDAANPFIMSLESGDTWKLERDATANWSTGKTISFTVFAKDDKGDTSSKAGTNFTTGSTC